MRFILLLSCLLTLSGFASNLTTSSIGVSWTGAQQISIDLQNIYFCTVDSIPAEQEVLLTSTCGDSIWVNLVGFHSPLPILTYCEIEDCTGSTPRGYTRYSYIDTVDLNSNCDNWVVHYFSGTRNGATNVVDGQSKYVYTSFLKGKDVGILEGNELIVCEKKKQIVVLKPAVWLYDSLDSELVPVMIGINTGAQYNVGHLFDSPFDSSSFKNGFLYLYHDSLDFQVIGVKNTFYENGVVVGETHSEIAIHVSDVDYNSHGPQWLSPGLIPLLPNVTSVDSLTVHVNPGDTLAFEMQFADSNLDDSLSLLGGPSAGMFYDTSGINPLHIVVHGSAPLRDTTLAVFFIISDSVCSDKDYYGTYFIKVGTGVSTGSDIIKNELMVFPNPARNVVFVKGLLEPTNYFLFDMSGKMLLHGLVSESQGIPLDGFKGGMYILQVEEIRFKLLLE